MFQFYLTILFSRPVLHLAGKLYPLTSNYRCSIVVYIWLRSSLKTELFFDIGSNPNKYIYRQNCNLKFLHILTGACCVGAMFLKAVKWILLKCDVKLIKSWADWLCGKVCKIQIFFSCSLTFIEKVRLGGICTGDISSSSFTWLISQRLAKGGSLE